MLYRAQLALLVSEPPSGPGWLHELKLDGYRIGVIISNGDVRLMSRRGNDWTAEFPELVRAAKSLRVKHALIDGEVVMLSESGISSFEALQKRGAKRGSLAYFAFDLLSIDGDDVSKLPLIDRKERLRDVIGGGDGVDIIRYTQHFEEPGDQVLRQACELGAEGIVSKRRDAPYRWGARNSDWQKSKCSKRQEFVVGGFTDPSGSRVGVGSLVIGYYEDAALRFAGKVGTGQGWNDAFGRDLRKKLEAIETDKCPFEPRPPGWLGRNAHWVKPKYVVEIEFTEWTAGGHIRHPSLQGFRRDKAPREVVREVPINAQRPASSVRQRHTSSVDTSHESPVGTSDASRVIYPKVRVTRADLLELYSDIAEWVMPHFENRPLTVVRCKGPIVREDALRSQCKFVRHTARDNAWATERVPHVRIQEKLKLGEYLYVDSVEALLALLEGGVVEWHAWNSRADDFEHPDRIVFDLDPGEGATWSQVVDTARLIRDVLGKLDLDSWPRTTGGRGLHVVVPFKAEHSWGDVFAFSRAVAELIVREDRDGYTTSFSKAERRNKILIDYKRNYRTSIAIAGFSTRAKPGAPIATPVAWREVTTKLSSDQFTVTNIRARLRRLERNRSDPWKDFWSSKQRLPRKRVDSSGPPVPLPS